MVECPTLAALCVLARAAIEDFEDLSPEEAAAVRVVGARVVSGEVQPIPKQGLPRPKKRRPLPPASPKRLAEKDRRDAVRAIVLARDPDCVGAARGLPGECASPWANRHQREVHETHQRSTHPGSHLDASKCVAMCQFHHDPRSRASVG
jgi:hypothetical protein